MSLYMDFLSNICKIPDLPYEIINFIDKCNDTLSYAAPEIYLAKIQLFSHEFNILMIRHKLWHDKIREEYIKIYKDIQFAVN